MCDSYKIIWGGHINSNVYINAWLKKKYISSLTYYLLITYQLCRRDLGDMLQGRLLTCVIREETGQTPHPSAKGNMALRAQRSHTGQLRTRLYTGPSGVSLLSGTLHRAWQQSPVQRSQLPYTEIEPSLKLVFPIRTLRSTALPSRVSP